MSYLYLAQGEAVSFAWRELLPAVMTTYRDGYVMGDVDKAVFTMTRMFYPKPWLDAVGYFKTHENNPGGLLYQPSPYSNTDAGAAATTDESRHRHFFGDDDRGDDDGASAVAPGSLASSSRPRGDWSHNLVVAYLFWCAVGSGVICALVGYLVGRYNALLVLKREVEEEQRGVRGEVGGDVGKGKGKNRPLSGYGVCYGSTSIANESLPPAAPTRVVVVNSKGSGRGYDHKSSSSSSSSTTLMSCDQGKAVRAKGSSISTTATATSTASLDSDRWGSNNSYHNPGSESREDMYWCYQQGGWRHRGGSTSVTANPSVVPSFPMIQSLAHSTESNPGSARKSASTAGSSKGIRTYEEHVQPMPSRCYQDDDLDQDHDSEYDASAGSIALTGRPSRTNTIAYERVAGCPDSDDDLADTDPAAAASMPSSHSNTKSNYKSSKDHKDRVIARCREIRSVFAVKARIRNRMHPCHCHCCTYPWIPYIYIYIYIYILF